MIFYGILNYITHLRRIYLGMRVFMIIYSIGIPYCLLCIFMADSITIVDFLLKILQMMEQCGFNIRSPNNTVEKQLDIWLGKPRAWVRIF